jgi:hypothetical protein
VDNGISIRLFLNASERGALHATQMVRHLQVTAKQRRLKGTDEVLQGHFFSLHGDESTFS